MTRTNADPAAAGVALAAAAADTGAVPAGPARAAPHAAETRRLYAADWAAFAKWCRERRLAARPAAPATVAAYLGSLAPALSHGALARRAAAIAGRHRQAGHPSPTIDLDVRGVLRTAHAAGRANGGAAGSGVAAPRPARRKPPPSPAQLTRMAARCSGDLAGLCDRALLLLAAAGIHGERLLALDRDHVELTGRGVDLTIGRADGAGAERLSLGRITGLAAYPARALEAWLQVSDTRFGPVFRKVNRWGAVEHRRLRPDGLRRIWRHRAKASRAERGSS